MERRAGSGQGRAQRFQKTVEQAGLTPQWQGRDQANMRTSNDNFIDKLGDLTSSVEFIKSKMMRDECDQMSKEMKQDQEKWEREGYKGDL